MAIGHQRSVIDISDVAGESIEDDYEEQAQEKGPERDAGDLAVIGVRSWECIGLCGHFWWQ